METISAAIQRKDYKSAYSNLLQLCEEDIHFEDKQQVLISKWVSQYIFEYLHSNNIECEQSLGMLLAITLEKSLSRSMNTQVVERLFVCHTLLVKNQLFFFLNKKISWVFFEYAQKLSKQNSIILAKEYLEASILLFPTALWIEAANTLLRILNGQSQESKIIDKKVIVTIPIYRQHMTEYEMISLIQCRRVLSKYDISFVVPANLCIDEYRQLLPSASIVSFSDDCFNSIVSYNRLVMSSDFYEKFISYPYLLIYQLDAFVFRDELELFCDMKYDYIGAPWTNAFRVPIDKEKPTLCYVGNGGFSLRHVKNSLEIILKMGNSVKKWSLNEDQFWAFCGEVFKKKFHVAPMEVAEKFSFEQKPRQYYEKSKQLPFGCHAWKKYDISFMRNLFLNYGYHI